MRRIGFTGTQLGMTTDQIISVENVLEEDLVASWAHHGDCIGADAQFHNLAVASGLRTHGHPPVNPSKRAWCQFDVIEEPKEYLDRNKDIVDNADFMVACPASYVEELRSGTWSTIRYTRKLGTPGIIVYPNGIVKDIKESY